MTEDNHVITPGLVFSFGKGAPEVRSDSQYVEIIRRNRRGRKRLRLTLGGQTDGAILVRGGGIGENVVSFAPRKVIWRRDRIRIGQISSRGIDGSNHCYAIWFMYDWTSQEESADETEHGGIRGDAERQGDNHCDCKSRILEQGTQRIAQVLKQDFQTR